jgi:4-hydroxybenzoate polyprenyltransferase
MMKSIKKYIVAFIRLARLRVIIFDYFWSLSAFSIIAAGFGVSLFNISISLFICLLVHSYAFIVNDCEDAEDDSMDPKKAARNPISSGYITYKQGILILQVTAYPALLLSYFTHGLPASIVILSALLTGHFYSWKKVRFKSFPVVDILSHSYAIAMFQVVYFLLLPNAKVAIPSYAILIGVGVFSMAGALYNQYRDFDVDVKANLRNTSITIGKENTKKVFIALYTVSLSVILAGVLTRILTGI